MNIGKRDWLTRACSRRWASGSQPTGSVRTRPPRLNRTVEAVQNDSNRDQIEDF
jgi:hypothetical protein